MNKKNKRNSIMGMAFFGPAFTFGGAAAVARVSKYEISQVGDEIEFVFMPSKLHFFDKETEECLF